MSLYGNLYIRIHKKTFVVLLKAEKRESLAQLIFSHLQYMLNCWYIYVHMYSVCTLACVILKININNRINDLFS